MPNTQVATVANYDFGAPVAEDVVLKFRVKENQGGKVDITVENESNVALEVTFQVSSDDVTYADTAVANVVIPAKTRSDATHILLRAGVDKFLRMQALGGTRGQLQIRPDSMLDLLRI